MFLSLSSAITKAYQNDPLSSFRKPQAKGVVEIIAGFTENYLYLDILLRIQAQKCGLSTE
jgi:hypothetical protein